MDRPRGTDLSPWWWQRRWSPATRSARIDHGPEGGPGGALAFGIRQQLWSTGEFFFAVDVTVGNDGAGNVFVVAADAALLPVDRRRTLTGVPSAADTEEGAGRTDKQKEIGALFAGDTRSHSIRLTAPSTAGTYYYGACLLADSVAWNRTPRTTARNRNP